MEITPVGARERAYEALQALTIGQHGAAGAILVELVAAGAPGAAEAVAEIAAGRWGKAVELLGAMVRAGVGP